MTLLTTVFLFQQRQFDSTTLLRSLAYSVALSVREAQTYGTSIRAFGGGFGAEAYGIYVNINSPGTYILFADDNDNGQYDTSPTNELVNTFTFSSNYAITDICALYQGSQNECASTNFIDWLAITFRRPNPDACIETDLRQDLCDASPVADYSQGYIRIRGPSGTTRSVTVTPTGQIAVGPVGS